MGAANAYKDRYGLPSMMCWLVPVMPCRSRYWVQDPALCRVNYEVIPYQVSSAIKRVIKRQWPFLPDKCDYRFPFASSIPRKSETIW